ncbi:hypothetical protein F2P81_000282 [Scophthalmus maximus]|uniref:Uncharacterized protein n=1 Tax=Scophthalmus maximus TaxID=52904 RepID=A0A6A4TP62_SCOMX|nr:hypothetical protein F2P81_000282 [Scophthalmus maximus]
MNTNKRVNGNNDSNDEYTHTAIVFNMTFDKNKGNPAALERCRPDSHIPTAEDSPVLNSTTGAVAREG